MFFRSTKRPTRKDEIEEKKFGKCAANMLQLCCNCAAIALQVLLLACTQPTSIKLKCLYAQRPTEGINL